MDISLQITISFIIISATHFVADFILQSRWEAENKSKNNIALTSHVISYTVFFLIALTIVSTILKFYFHSEFLQPYFIVMFVGMNGFLHWITDYITSRINSHLWGKGDAHNFFVAIGADQFIHFATLYSTFYYFFLQ